MLSRRQFLLGAVGLAVAPAIVRAESLMKIWVPKQYLEFSLELPLEPNLSRLPGTYHLSFWAAKDNGEWFKYSKQIHTSDIKDRKVRIDVSQVRDTSFSPGTIHSNHPLVMTNIQLERSGVPNRIINPDMVPYGRI